MSETLLPLKKTSPKTSSCSGKVVYGGLLLTALAGAVAWYAMVGEHEEHISNIVRVIDGEINVKHLSSMKHKWLYFNDVSLQMETLSPYMMQGKLIQGAVETSFSVNAVDKIMSLGRKNANTGLSESFYSSKNTLSDQVIYQFTNEETKVSEDFEAFQDFLSSSLLSDTYMISIKLAQYGLTGKSSPVVKGFYSIAQTLAKQEIAANTNTRYTKEMAKVIEEINAKMEEEKSKSAKESLLWTKADLLDEKLMIGPCGRYQDCTCETENRTASCGNACFGRCGRNCDCWMFVCGDCDCHCFCYDHDYYCSCVSKADIHCWGIWLWFDACC